MSPTAGHLVAGKRVIVAGAGLGGLAFGLSLLKVCKEASISPLPKVQLFEREANAEARVGQGYSLGLKDGGLQVMQRLGVLDALLAQQPPGNSGSLATSSFNVLATLAFPMPPTGLPDRIRVPRSALRQTLQSALRQQLPAGGISYGRTCVSASGGRDGSPLQLTFQDGSSEDCDILVAADGSNSKLRASLLPEEQLQHSGIIMFAGRAQNLDPLPDLLAKGSVIATAPTGVSMFISALDKHSAHWNFGWRGPQSTAAELNALIRDPATAQQAANVALEKGAPFAEPWPTLWKHTPLSELWARALMEKLPHKNDTTCPVIFIGDSCHAMTPFSGNGANMAFADAMQLAQQLADPSNSTLQAAVAAYDAESGPRSAAAVLAGRTNMAIAHKTGLSRLMVLTVLWLVGAAVRVQELHFVKALRRLIGR